MIKRLTAGILFFLFIILSPPAFSQEKTNIFQYEAKVISEKSTPEGKRYGVEVTRGNLKGKKYTTAIESGTQKKGNQFKIGEEVVIVYSKNPAGGEIVYIVDYVRRTPLSILLLVFLFFVLLVGRLKGATSFIGMILSLVLIMQFVIPNIVAGNDPILVTLLASLFMLPLLFFLGHGFSKKTILAIVGTFFTLALTGILAYLFVIFTRLTGYAAEEALFLQTVEAGLNIRSLLLAGIIIGAMGVLDDVTISQISIVEKLKETNHQFGFGELYRHAMDLGRDHVASLVNTLILVYTGAALPLLLLFYNSKSSYITIINQEIVATEIVRTLVSSIGIIAAVPITTALAAYFYRKNQG